MRAAHVPLPAPALTLPLAFSRTLPPPHLPSRILPLLCLLTFAEEVSLHPY